jgi:hypothetical protein
MLIAPRPCAHRWQALDDRHGQRHPSIKKVVAVENIGLRLHRIGALFDGQISTLSSTCRQRQRLMGHILRFVLHGFGAFSREKCEPSSPVVPR